MSHHDLSLPSQLLLKQLEQISGQDILILGMPEREAALELINSYPNARLTFFTFDFAAYKKLHNLDSRAEIVFSSWYRPKQRHDTAIIYLPKSDELIRMVFALAHEVVQASGAIFIVGQKNAGIKSQGKDIQAAIGPVGYSDSARHSTIYKAENSNPPAPTILEDWFTTYDATLNSTTFTVASLPGVFSHGRLDEGTRLLAETLDTAMRPKTVLDMGCGSGAIGVYAQHLWPEARIDMVDSNALAIAATQKTLSLNKVAENRVFASDAFSEVTDTYDLILSNPPFHDGIDTDYRMVENFIQSAPKYLKRHGELRIVANNFLQYRPLIAEAFGGCEIVKQDTKYRVYRAIKR